MSVTRNSYKCGRCKVVEAAVYRDGANLCLECDRNILNEYNRKDQDIVHTPKVEDTLAERGKRYGSFQTHANITQRLKFVMQGDFGDLKTNWGDLSDSQHEALEMIAHKIGRILNGDPNYADSWHDIAGYATLVEKELNGEAK